MTTRKDSGEAASVPTAHPDPECNTGYAEPKPKDKAQASAMAVCLNMRMIPLL